MWTAAALGIRSSRVRGLVMGEHGHSQVMLWSSLKVDGRPVQVNEEDKAKIQTLPPQTLHDYETLKPKRTAGWTSAVGTATIINAITNNTQELIPCSAILDGEYGCRNMSMSVPAIIGRDGVHYIRIVDMNEQEQAGLQKSIDFLTSMMRHVEQYPGIK
jgi:malate/lactate dehydrogenase